MQLFNFCKGTLDLCNELLRATIIAPRLRPGKRRRQRAAFYQQLEARTLLSGNPVANNDSYLVGYQSSAGGNVLANDTDPNSGAVLTAHLVAGPSHAGEFT